MLQCFLEFLLEMEKIKVHFNYSFLINTLRIHFCH